MTIANAPPIPSVRRISAEHFELMPDSKDYELDNGVLVERHVGAESDYVALELMARVRDFVRSNRLGWTFGSETGYRCFGPEEDRVRKPDGSFIRFGRLEGETIPRGWIALAPDLVVESISPGDEATELERKLIQYRSAGIPLIWVIYPTTRTAHVLHAAGGHTILSETDFLDGEDVLPGFRLRLGELFPPAGTNPQPLPADSR